MPDRRLPIAVLISGGGSTLKNLIELSNSGSLDIDIRLVISSRREARGIDFAKEANIPVEIIRRRDFATAESFRDANFDAIRQAQVQLVVMGGYLAHLLIPEDFQGRVVNIHPSLIPAFCGQGFYGLAVHKAAIEYGVKVSGCTVHFVDNQFDHGPIIAQQVCAVEPTDTAEQLQSRVGQLERELLPKVVQAIAERKIRLDANTRMVHWD